MSAARNCELLGVCQNPERECPGACEAAPKLPALDGADLAAQEPSTSVDDPAPQPFSPLMCAGMWLILIALGASAVIALGMCAGYLWQWWTAS